MPGFKSWTSGEVLSAASLNSFMTQQIIAIKPSDESVANTTLQNDDHLFLSVSANTDYILDGIITFRADDTVGINVGFTGPSGASLNWTVFAYFGTGNITIDAMTLTAVQGLQGLGSGGGSNVFRRALYPKGILRIGGTSGTFQFRWAQSNSSANATLVAANSYIRLTKVS